MPQVIEPPRDRSTGSGDGDRLNRHNNQGGGGGGGNGGGSEAFPIPTGQVGLWLFLAAGSILFSAMVSAYIVRIGFPGWHAQAIPVVMWVNTALLILASIMLERSRRSAASETSSNPRGEFLAGGLLGILFIIGQVIAWQQLHAGEHFVQASPATGFFYLITGLHGLHLVGGLVAWAIVASKLWRSDSPAEHQLGMKLCTIYWHFLLIVWMVMFALMQIT